MFHAPFIRRSFLARSSLIALAPTVPAFMRRTARAAPASSDGRILVVIQLSGGNDGINSVVPYADEGYAKNRDKLRLPTDQLIKLTDQVGLHPGLRLAADLVEDGRLAIVQGVGYPNPNRSHDVSMAIWQTARFQASEHKTFGWIGRAMDQHEIRANGAPKMILLGDEDPPIAIRGRKSRAVSLAYLDDLTLDSTSVVHQSRTTAEVNTDIAAFVRRAALDAYATADLIRDVTQQAASGTFGYPASELAGRLRSIAHLIKTDFGAPVYYAIQTGYDTHAAQLPTHAQLLRDLAGALKAFLDDLQAAKLDDRVVVLCFSEFGRRVKENASFGTDHGTAGPIFVAGPSVTGGLIGPTPSLEDLQDGDLKMSVDFRQVYATLLHEWLRIDPESALGGRIETVPLFT